MKKIEILADPAKAYDELAKRLRSLPLLAQGNVFAIEPSPDSPRARTRYMWTRKVKAKTVTKALSHEQYEVLKAAKGDEAGQTREARGRLEQLDEERGGV